MEHTTSSGSCMPGTHAWSKNTWGLEGSCSYAQIVFRCVIAWDFAEGPKCIAKKLYQGNNTHTMHTHTHMHTHTCIAIGVGI
eukprot:scaffold88942_cov27-Tisochrysis_lutea.AAC.1